MLIKLLKCGELYNDNVLKNIFINCFLILSIAVCQHNRLGLQEQLYTTWIVERRHCGHFKKHSMYTQGKISIIVKTQWSAMVSEGPHRVLSFSWRPEVKSKMLVMPLRRKRQSWDKLNLICIWYLFRPHCAAASLVQLFSTQLHLVDICAKITSSCTRLDFSKIILERRDTALLENFRFIRLVLKQALNTSRSPPNWSRTQMWSRKSNVQSSKLQLLLEESKQ